jgi:hypothetical protein
MMSGNGHSVGNFVNDVQFFDGDLIYFVQHVYARNVHPAERDKDLYT